MPQARHMSFSKKSDPLSTHVRSLLQDPVDKNKKDTNIRKEVNLENLNETRRSRNSKKHRGALHLTPLKENHCKERQVTRPAATEEVVHFDKNQVRRKI